jgi:hypothetical protein
MSLGRLIPVLSAVVLAGGVALAQPNPTPAPAPADGAGSAVAPIEDAPPSDMEGTSEDPDAPRGTIDEAPVPTGPAPTVQKTGYPIEEAQRPITVPQNMSEISLTPQFMASPFVSNGTLRARYGITRQIQLGLTYVIGGVYDDPDLSSEKKAFQVGKTGGLEVTVLIKNWLGVRVGLPVYFDPFAMSFAAGAPMKFIFEKFAIGGLDDVINIKIAEFAPRYDYELINNIAAAGIGDNGNNTQQSRGFIRLAGYGIYQQKPNLALIGRLGAEFNLGAGGSAGAAGTSSETQYFLKAGVQFSPRRFLDVGVLAGFEDLSKSGSFGLTGILAVRI